MSRELVLHQLTRDFGKSTSPVLDGVDLVVPAGGCAALLGPTGSGKSTVVRLIAGLDTADAGNVTIGGKPMAGVPPEQRRAAVVFQRPRLFPHLSVLDNVAFPLAVRGESRAQARRHAAHYLDLLGVSELDTRRTRWLSGGQEQRVALARALASGPDVLVLDEPFSALDPQVRSQMHSLLAELRAAVDVTILLVTHDRAEAAAVADTVAVLLDGRVAQHAPIDTLFSRPASLAVHRFLGGVNAIPGVVADSVHRSAIGGLRLPADAGRLCGPATLTFRQESVALAGVETDPETMIGTVAAVRPMGGRWEATVDIASTLVHAEVRAGDPLAVPGRPVGLVIPLDQRHVIDGSPVAPTHVDAPE